MATTQKFMSNNGIIGELIEGKDLDYHFQVMSKSLFAKGCEIDMKERIIHQLRKQGGDGKTCLVGFEVHGTIENGRQPRGISLVQECKFPFELFHLEMTAPGCSVLAQPGLNATITRFLGKIEGSGVVSRDATDQSLMEDGLYFFVKHYPANEISEQLNVTFETELSVTSELNFIFIYILQPDAAASSASASASESTLKCIRIIPPLASERDNKDYGKFEIGQDKTLSYTEGIKWTEERVLRKAAKLSGLAREGARSRCDTSYIDVSYYIQQAKHEGNFNGLFSNLERVIMLRGNCSPSYADFPAFTREKPITRAMLERDIRQYSDLMKKVSEIFFNGFKFGLLVSYMVSKIRDDRKKKSAVMAPSVASASRSSCPLLTRKESTGVPGSDATMSGEEGDEEEILNRLVIELLMNSMLKDSKNQLISSLPPLPTLEVVKIVSSLFVDIPRSPHAQRIFEELLTTRLRRIIPAMTKFDLVSASDKDKILKDKDYNYKGVLERMGLLRRNRLLSSEERHRILSRKQTGNMINALPSPEARSLSVQKIELPAKRRKKDQSGDEGATSSGGARKTRKRRRKRKTKRNRKPKRKTKKRHRQRHRRSRK